MNLAVAILGPFLLLALVIALAFLLERAWPDPYGEETDRTLAETDRTLAEIRRIMDETDRRYPMTRRDEPPC